MSRRLYRPPFHRQILPWLFAAVFFALAPVLIFYTSGYRINTKKSVIDRTGTVIVDSTPRGARVILDGNDAGGTTAMTLQEISPGPHTIEVQRDGYFPWRKRLDVKAEQVTFVNSIWLVRTGDPEFRIDVPARTLEAHAGRNLLAVLSEEAAEDLPGSPKSSISLTLWSGTNNTQRTAPVLTSTDIENLKIRFEPNGRSLLLGGADERSDAIWFSTDGAVLRSEALPSANYFWNGTDLLGLNDTHSITWEADDETLSQVRVTSTLLHTFAPLELVHPTGTNALALRHQRQANTLYQLSGRDWRFAGRQGGFTLLNRNDSWLAVSTNDVAHSKEAQGSEPVWFERNQTSGLLKNGNEISIWNLNGEREVIWRRSDPVVAVDWHRSGEIIFLATEHEILAMELDPRDGRLIYNLGEFDRVYDIAMLNRELFVAAEKDGKRGVFVFKPE